MNMEKRKKINPEKEIEKTEEQKEKNSEIAVGNHVFASCTFESLGLHPKLCEQLKDKLGFETPTHIQAQAIPVLLSGKHALVNAATGTGKTLVYLAPVIHHLLNRFLKRTDGTFALVLVPTHELCMQVYEGLQKLLHRLQWIVPGYLMGGENRAKEKARLRKGVSILIATPGRLLDHLKHTSSFVYTNLHWLIFDEADRILELGFGKEIEEILTILGSRQNRSAGENKVQRQNMLLSATLNDKVNHLANISLDNPITIGLGNVKMQTNPSHKSVGCSKSDVDNALQGSAILTNPSISEFKLPSQLIQRYVKVSCGSRLVVLISILKKLFEESASQKIVVFFSTCDAVDFHHSLLSEFQWPPKSLSEAESKLFLGCKTYRLHGNMNHEDRRTTFNAFKTEKSALLLSTDVSARGLDFPKVRCIIQYDSPGEATEYVHRVGRTARMGEKGDSLLFLQPIETDYLHDLERHGVLLTEYPLLKLLDSFPLYGHNQNVKKFISLDMHPWVFSLQKALESFILNKPLLKKLAMDAFCSWVRAYSAHRGDLKSIFMVKKLHLGHVAKSFALKEQPSFVGKSFLKQAKKRARDQKQKGRSSKKRRITTKS